MILIDANQITISQLMTRCKVEKKIDINSVRRAVLTHIAKLIKQFGSHYGEIVFCYDDQNYWRKQIFPYYKGTRKKEREKSEIDWDLLFSVLNKIRDEIRIYFPYKVIQAQGAEADDVIATLCLHNSYKDKPERILILSADKDFIQLQKFKFVKQYDPRRGWITHTDPQMFLNEQIIRGDRSDGIPNILTADDALVNNTPQKRISKDKFTELSFLQPNLFQEQSVRDNWQRNSQLIDLTLIPMPVQERILDLYYKVVTPKQVHEEYFHTHNISHLLVKFQHGQTSNTSSSSQ